MGSRQLLPVIGLSLVLSIMLVPSLEHAFAPHEKCFETKKSTNEKFTECNLIQPRIPPIGSVYVINLSGVASLPTTGMVKPASVHLELNVTGVKTTGTKTVFLTVVKGDLKLGDDTYSLTKGSVSIPRDRVNIKASTADGLKILTVLAALTDILPVSKSDEPVGLVPESAHDAKSADIKIALQKWFIDKFDGNISRIA